jgi:hypothetical protein
LRTLEVLLGDFELIDRHEHIGSFDQVFWRYGIRFADAGLSKRKADLLSSKVALA